MRTFPPRKQSEIAQIKLRLKEPLRLAIEKAAKANGVSMNAEVISRLQRSFHYDDILKMFQEKER